MSLKFALTLTAVTGLSVGALYVSYEMKDYFMHPIQSTLNFVGDQVKTIPRQILDNAMDSVNTTAEYRHDLFSSRGDVKTRVKGAVGLISTPWRIFYNGVAGVFGSTKNW